MQKIKAKPVIRDTYWILQINDQKIGQVEAGSDGFTVKIKGKHDTTFKSLSHLKKSNLFDFVEFTKEHQQRRDVSGYPTNAVVFNTMWHLKHKVPLFTKEPNSKSWHGAGWYTIIIEGNVVVEFCPKLITLQRNKFTGPFKEKPKCAYERLFE